jgi:hypothetical protein
VGIDADAAAAGGVPQIDLAWAGGEVAIRILGIDAALDGVTARLGVDDVLESGRPAAMRICSLIRSQP